MTVSKVSKVTKNVVKRDSVGGRNFTMMNKELVEGKQAALGALLLVAAYAEIAKDRAMSRIRLGKDLKKWEKALGVGRQSAQNYYDELKGLGCIIEDGDDVYLNPIVGYTGALEKLGEWSYTGSIKLFHINTRLLREQGCSLERLGLLYRLIPYISIENNCLYAESNINKGLLSTRKLSELSGIPRRTLMAFMAEAKLEIGGTLYPLLASLDVAPIKKLYERHDLLQGELEKKRTALVVNPVIFHGYSNNFSQIFKAFWDHDKVIAAVEKVRGTAEGIMDRREDPEYMQARKAEAEAYAELTVGIREDARALSSYTAELDKRCKLYSGAVKMVQGCHEVEE